MRSLLVQTKRLVSFQRWICSVNVMPSQAGKQPEIAANLRCLSSHSKSYQIAIVRMSHSRPRMILKKLKVAVIVVAQSLITMMVSATTSGLWYVLYC
jgi:hypothetical protein